MIDDIYILFLRLILCVVITVLGVILFFAFIATFVIETFFKLFDKEEQ